MWKPADQVWALLTEKAEPQVGPEPALPARLADFRATAPAAWHVHLELFFAAGHDDIRCPWPTERTEDLQERYGP